MYNAYSSSLTTYMISSLHLYYFLSLQYILIKIEWWGGFFMPSRGRGVGNGALVDNRTSSSWTLSSGMNIRGSGKGHLGVFNNHIVLINMHL